MESTTPSDCISTLPVELKLEIVTHLPRPVKSKGTSCCRPQSADPESKQSNALPPWYRCHSIKDYLSLSLSNRSWRYIMMPRIYETMDLRVAFKSRTSRHSPLFDLTVLSAYTDIIVCTYGRFCKTLILPTFALASDETGPVQSQYVRTVLRHCPNVENVEIILPRGNDDSIEGWYDKIWKPIFEGLDGLTKVKTLRLAGEKAVYIALCPSLIRRLLNTNPGRGAINLTLPSFTVHHHSNFNYLISQLSNVRHLSLTKPHQNQSEAEPVLLPINIESLHLYTRSYEEARRAFTFIHQDSLRILKSFHWERSTPLFSNSPHDCDSIPWDNLINLTITFKNCHGRGLCFFRQATHLEVLTLNFSGSHFDIQPVVDILSEDGPQYKRLHTLYLHYDSHHSDARYVSFHEYQITSDYRLIEFCRQHGMDVRRCLDHYELDDTKFEDGVLMYLVMAERPVHRQGIRSPGSWSSESSDMD